ncbi:MAG: SurA N-terminal domain-containing protein [Desulfovibrio sp.]|nr:SurA N-terminal domain-containing protein [Desulfovibrio sp.]
MSIFCKIAVTFLVSLSFLIAAQASEITLNKIAAVINGEMITLHELRRHLGAELARQRIAPDDPRVPELQSQVLDSMINDILIRQEAKRYKITVSDGEVEAELKKIIARSGMSSEQFAMQMKKEGTTRELLKERLADTLLRQRVSNFMIVRKIIVTKEEVEEYYEKHKSEFSGQKVANFSIIMLPEKLNTQSIYQQLLSGTLSFEEGAAKYSADQSAEQKGHVVGIAWDRLPQDMQKLLSSLKDGQMSPLLRTQGGFVIIRRDGVEDAKPLTLQEATPLIEEIIRAPRLEERFKEYTSQLRSKAVLDIRM